jgi:hypothetical protein
MLRKESLIEIVSGLSALQRRFAAAMAAGAQALILPGGHTYEAWKEDVSTGKLVVLASGLRPNEMAPMKLLLPMIETGHNDRYGYEFFYVPAYARAQLQDLLTLTMPAPTMFEIHAEWMRKQQQGNRAESIPQAPRMTA